MEISYHKEFVEPDPGFLEGRVERLMWEWESARLEDCRAVWEWRTGSNDGWRGLCFVDE